MIQIEKSQIDFISKATIELSHAMGLMAPITRSIVFVGSNRVTADSPHKKYFDMAVEIAEVMAREGWNCITGGGQGINEAATLGAGLGNAKSVGIRLLSEFKNNRKPDVPIRVTNPFNRKVLFDLFSDAYIFFPGGFGTLDALFEAITLQQTRKIDPKPLICVGEDYWKPLLQPLFDACLDKKYGTIAEKDLRLLHFTDNYREIARIIWQHRTKTLKTKGKAGFPSFRSRSPKRAQAFAHNVAMELFSAFHTYRGIGHGVTIFGSSRTQPNGEIYERAVSLAQEIGNILKQMKPRKDLRGAIITGGGPGNMEAANKGARLSGAPSLGLGIDIPLEQGFNSFVDDGLGYEFKYFFCRKWLFSMLTDIFIATPGGMGTMDELFEMIAMKQHYMKMNPKFTAQSVFCVNRDFWQDPLNNIVDQLLSLGFMQKNHVPLLNFDFDEAEAIMEIKKILLGP